MLPIYSTEDVHNSNNNTRQLLGGSVRSIKNIQTGHFTMWLQFATPLASRTSSASLSRFGIAVLPSSPATATWHRGRRLNALSVFRRLRGMRSYASSRPLPKTAPCKRWRVNAALLCFLIKRIARPVARIVFRVRGRANAERQTAGPDPLELENFNPVYTVVYTRFGAKRDAPVSIACQRVRSSDESCRSLA